MDDVSEARRLIDGVKAPTTGRHYDEAWTDELRKTGQVWWRVFPDGSRELVEARAIIFQDPPIWPVFELPQFDSAGHRMARLPAALSLAMDMRSLPQLHRAFA